MIRFIFRQKSKLDCGLEDETFFTMDIDVPNLEAELTRGGYGETTYMRTRLLAVEVIPTLALEKEETK